MRTRDCLAVRPGSVWPLVMAILLTVPSLAFAQQEPLLGEIKWVPYNFAPRGWADCNGQLLSIAQNTALFSLLGTTFGGDGRTTFALPDMRGRVSVHAGQGPGLSNRDLGEVGGEETHTLTVAEIPSHDHSISSHTHAIPALNVDVKASSADATTTSPQGNVLANAAASAGGGNGPGKGKGKGPDKDDVKATSIYNAGPANVSLAAGSAMTEIGTTGGGSGTTMPTGGGAAHQNMQPFLGLRCIIAVEGIFPSRQ
jgi:microcystin-dependent protein